MVENTGGLDFKQMKDGRVVFGIKAGSQFTYPDGRNKLGNGVEVTADRNGKPFTVTSRDAEIVLADEDLKTAHFTTAVKLTSQGTEVTGDDATYDKAEGIVRIPGAVAFTRGRMKGTGVGATYDLNREVLWLLDRAHITVAADDKDRGARRDRRAAGWSRRYYGTTPTDTSTRRTRIDADETRSFSAGRSARADTQLRGNSRIRHETAAPAVQSARDIDLTYGDDGRTLAASQLVGERRSGVPAKARERAGVSR